MPNLSRGPRPWRTISSPFSASQAAADRPSVVVNGKLVGNALQIRRILHHVATVNANGERYSCFIVCAEDGPPQLVNILRVVNAGCLPHQFN